MSSQAVLPIAAGTYELGPADGSLTVRTTKSGAAAKAGHNLLIEVTVWAATLQVGDETAATTIDLLVDGRSLEVVDGSGGIQALSDDDKVSIKQTIDTDVLKGGKVAFHSRSVQLKSDGVTMLVSGELEMLGKRALIAFELQVGDGGRLRGGTEVKQTALGIKPYSALFGALRVVDEVQVAIDVQLPSS